MPKSAVHFSFSALVLLAFLSASRPKLLRRGLSLSMRTSVLLSCLSNSLSGFPSEAGVVTLAAFNAANTRYDDAGAELSHALETSFAGPETGFVMGEVLRRKEEFRKAAQVCQSALGLFQKQDCMRRMIPLVINKLGGAFLHGGGPHA